MERSRDSTQDKCSNENLFMATLLLCGPDPEPHERLASDAYDEWRTASQSAMESLGVSDVHVWTEYRRWLASNGMAWRNPNEQ